MEMFRVKFSSNVIAQGYDPETKKLKNKGGFPRKHLKDYKYRKLVKEDNDG